MRKDTALVLINGRPDDVLAIRTEVPKITEKMLAKCLAAGVSQANVKNVCGLVEVYEKPLYSVVRHMGDGYSLERIEECFELQSKLEGLTFPMANKYLSSVSFQVEDISVVLEILLESAGRDFMAPNRLAHIIEERFGDDILGAYHLAIDDPDAYRDVLAGHLEWTGSDPEGGWDGRDL